MTNELNSTWQADTAPHVSEGLSALVASLGELTSGPVHNWSKWEARSGLQKCIRRGLEKEAIGCAVRLAALDAPYLWRSLNIIALEDLGVASPLSVLWTRQIIANPKAAFTQVPPMQGLFALVASMCRSIKSRACCEMSIGMDWSTSGKNMLAEAANWSGEKLLEACCGETFWQECYAALAHLSNRLPKDMPRNPTAAALKPQALLRMRKVQMPAALKEAALLSFDKPTDTMALAVWPIALVLQRRTHCMLTVVPDALPESETFNGLPAATWDMHVSQGKVALKAFWTSLSKPYPLAMAQIPPESASRAMGAAVFVEEGGMVDRRLRSAWLDELKDWQDKTLCVTYGVPADVYKTVRQIVREEIPRLNSKRKWVLTAFND